MTTFEEWYESAYGKPIGEEDALYARRAFNAGRDIGKKELAEEMIKENDNVKGVLNDTLSKIHSRLETD
ncbi:hypothetical protein SAMN04487977_101548 [Treponema bryantii]|uniref:Uncharacterized protein n=1 Tax=Treponema bryantii TaxID=163 RepID=A0A1H9B2L0_9SPIR|nr:hypothetical protein [Treponema bryantii]SEP82931.1 hypothetical protein SAMN04487977_101548 [Treponema bryantii]